MKTFKCLIWSAALALTAAAAAIPAPPGGSVARSRTDAAAQHDAASAWSDAGSMAAPARATAPATAPLGRITPMTPVKVPYIVSATNHLIIRMKINGHGPYNFVVDTGAPTMLLDEAVAAQIGLKADAPPVLPATRAPAIGYHSRHDQFIAQMHDQSDTHKSAGAAAQSASSASTKAATRGAATRGATSRPHPHWSTIDRLDIEGGITMRNVKCVVLTPYQLTGMNAIGAAGVQLHGLLGYSVLARFRMRIDMTKDYMVWTAQKDFTPPALQTGGKSDSREDSLESMGALLKILGPLVKPRPIVPHPRGFAGIELAVKDGGVAVDRVLPGGPADKAGVLAGDRIEEVNDKPVHTIAAMRHADDKTLPGTALRLRVQRDGKTIDLKITTVEGM